jgi:SAM-dependent methyltransferase
VPVTDRDERDFWDRRAAAWERRADALSAFSDGYGIPAMDALRAEGGEVVLDIGCGPGTTAIELAARVMPDGRVVGVDISPAMVAAATRRAARAGVGNARFVAVDAETGDLGEHFDAAYSRFGVMFFAHPAAAFANIHRALRSGGRFACVVWGPLTDNPWMFVPTLAAAHVLEADLTIPGPSEPGPFSLADDGRVASLLHSAGFVDVTVDVVTDSRFIFASTANDDVCTLLEVGPLGEAFGAADADTRQAAVDSVLGAIEPYRDGDGWRLPGSALKVTARKP